MFGVEQCQHRQKCWDTEREQNRKPKAQMKTDAAVSLGVFGANNALRKRTDEVEKIRDTDHDQVADALKQSRENGNLEVRIVRHERRTDNHVSDECENARDYQADIVTKATCCPPSGGRNCGISHDACRVA